jgi:four helix bundle protein
MRNDRENIIVNLSFKFSLKVVNFCELLEENKKFVIARQLLKSGTSIGANIREAQNSESKNDFIHKFKIAAKEVDETAYWLEICKEIESYPFDLSLIEDLESIARIINKIIATSKTSSREQFSN